MTTSTITRYTDPTPIPTPTPTPTPTAGAGGADREPPIGPPERRVAAVMYPLDRSEAAALQGQLGAAWTIAEGRHCEDPDLVIVRPSSPQTIAGLRQRFPTARLIAIEPTPADPAATNGPISRALAAGLDRYFLDVKDLSSAVDNRATRPCRHRSARWRRRAVS
jgi:hypothetical protein